MTIQFTPTVSMELPWRKTTPLHRYLGVRAMRFNYGATATLPSVGTPQGLNLRYDASTGIDRIIGFTLAIGNAPTGANFLIQELNTGWFMSYSYQGSKGVTICENIETFPDEVMLQWSFDQNIAAPVYMSFVNIEIVPRIII